MILGRYYCIFCVLKVKHAFTIARTRLYSFSNRLVIFFMHVCSAIKREQRRAGFFNHFDLPWLLRAILDESHGGALHLALWMLGAWEEEMTVVMSLNGVGLIARATHSVRHLL